MRIPRARQLVRGAAFALVVFVGTASTPGAAPSRVRLATLLPQGSSEFQSLEQMGQEWRTASSGAVTLTIYAGGTMGSEEEVVRRMRIGQIQAATLSVGGLSEIDPAVGALQKIPMVYRSLDELEFVRSKMEPELEARLNQKGFVVLFWADAGWVHIFSRQQALRPEDFRKMKLFVGASDQNEVRLVKGMRFNAVPLEWSDVLTSLQTGLVDTVPTVPFMALAGQYDSVARHMLDVNWVPLVGATVITKKAWETLPAELQANFKSAAVQAGQQIQQRSRQESDEAVAAMRKRGLQVHTVSPELDAEWRHFAEDVYPSIRGTMVPNEMFDEVMRLLSEYRSKEGKA